ncbi:hypothetical protein BT96DRAFT_1001924 [Gymnopus androsaceus JB14]|uniref:Uncharacterized protein n=1 Tax=Gymnopus androsaceus JB14 TaxID=1447944 RepID=A0A6A4H0R5_9AGAR|nr:hypothetical protein BT96DRAFT_1001924 [Gymnopus androsaceus JB14]
MGWLLQVPIHNNPATGKLPAAIELVFPMQWHHDYLIAMLNPPRPTPAILERMLFDELLVPSATLREAIYEAEFKNAADEVTKDSSFLLQQVRTQGGATVDFTCPKKGWVIELMRDGHDVEGHIMRFDPDTGNIINGRTAIGGL